MAQTILIAEIGTSTTRVTLVGEVEREEHTLEGVEPVRTLEMRVLGQAETMSTLEAPYGDVLAAILEAAAQVGAMTGRTLMRDGALVMPRTSDGDGIDRLVVVTSAAGTMSVAVIALASDVSARSAVQATRAIYASVPQIITLDDDGPQTTVTDAGWIEQQVELLISRKPDLIVMAGGLEGGAVESVTRLAHIVALTGMRATLDEEGRPQPDLLVRPVVYAGNSQARERVLEVLSGRAETFVVENLHPALNQVRLEPVRRELMRLYDERVLSRLPGAAGLRRMRGSLTTTAAASGVTVRYLAERLSRNVLALDLGSASTLALLCSEGRYSPAVVTGCGTGFGLGAIPGEVGVAALPRWLPFPASELELTHWLLNKLLRPHLHPASREDLFIEHAVARELLRLAYQALCEERADAPYDLLVASGGVLVHAPHPGMALLTVLDALQPAPMAGGLTLDVQLDSLGMLAGAGALAAHDPAAAVTLIERDLLGNVPLATVVVASGGQRAGGPLLEAELRPVGAEPVRITVQAGQIGRLPLSPGMAAQLVLRPAAGVRVGAGQAGAEVSTDLAAIRGSLLGVVIDGRGRPLPTGEPAQQRAQLWEWLAALGAVNGPGPYAGMAEVADLPPATPIERISTPKPVSQPRDEPPVSELDRDLAKLRRGVEQPKRRGIFRR